MDDRIATAAEAEEDDVLPRMHEVHADPDAPVPKVPPKMTATAERKSPARWAYERLILYIRNFEKDLDEAHEVAMGFAGGDAGVIRIQGLGYFDPDVVTFYGTDPAGTKTQLIQHVTQLNVLLRAMPKAGTTEAPRRIGFRLAREIDGPAADGQDGEDALGGQTTRATRQDNG